MILIITNQSEVSFNVQKIIDEGITIQSLSYSEFSQKFAVDMGEISTNIILFDLTDENPTNLHKNIPDFLEETYATAWMPVALIKHPDQRTLAQKMGATDYILYPFESEIDRQKLNNLIQVQIDRATLLDEMQASVTQDAFVSLIARMIGEKLDIESIVSRTLEQTIPLLNAIAGAIWLVSPQKQTLELASYITSRSDFNPSKQIPIGKGLVGWVAAHQEIINVFGHKAIDDPRYDVLIDNCISKIRLPFLIVPLKNYGETIGVMSICAEKDSIFSERQIVLLDSVTDLAASAILNARLIKELRENAAQLRALYEMSQQVAGGLDLKTTLNRALQWASRLCETEYGILWLIDPQRESLEPQASIGITLSPIEPLTHKLTEMPFAEVAQSGNTAIYNGLTTQAEQQDKICQSIKVNPENVIVIPIRYQSEITGFLTLLNKVGGDFTNADATLLSTAGEMIGIAIGNAHLHAQALALMEERQRLTNQAIHSERLATVGRLTASLAHEINNPMQAIRGALTLALEDLSDLHELDLFIRMSLTETDRVVQLVNRMRQIYRPMQDDPEALLVSDLLRESISIATKELRRQDVYLETEYSPEPIKIWGVGNQLHLVFLSLLLNFSDSLSEIGGGNLAIQEQMIDAAVSISFTTTADILSETSWLRTFETGIPYKETNTSFGSYLSHDIIKNHEGEVSINLLEDKVILTIQFQRVSQR